MTKFRVILMSELTCRRCGISNPQEFDVSCLIVDTSLVSCIAQVYKSTLSRRTKCHSRKKTREKETAHLTQVEDFCKATEMERNRRLLVSFCTLENGHEHSAEGFWIRN